MDTKSATDFSTLSDEQLDAEIAAAEKAQTQPAGFTLEDIETGLSETERPKLADPTFAKTALDRHTRFFARTAAGEDPLETGDYELFRWQRRTQKKQGPGIAAALWEGVKQTAGDAFEAGVETMAIAGKYVASDLQRPREAMEMKQEAVKAGADLATVSAAKALSFNNLIVRSVGLWANKFADTVRGLTADTASREFMDEVYTRHLFDVERANRADEKTAENFHRDVTAAVPQLAGILGTTEVNQRAANFLSNIPQMAVEGAVALSVSGASRATAKGAFDSAAEKLVAARTDLAAARAARDTLEASGQASVPGALRPKRALEDLNKRVAGMEADVAAREAALAELRTSAAKEAQDLTAAASSRVAAGRALGAVGSAAEAVGGLAEKLRTVPRAIAEKIAPTNELAVDAVERTIQGAALGAAGYAVGNEVGGAAGAVLGGSGIARANPGVLRTAGRDIRRIGEVFALGEATLPIARNVSKARDISGFTRAAAAFMDNSAIAIAADSAVRAGKGAAAAGVVGAGFGVLTNPDDPVSGAAQGAGGGAVFGASVGFLGQWRSYANSGQVMRERAGQLRIYKDLLKARPDELKTFEALPEDTQTTLAHYLAAQPDLKVNYINDPSRTPGSYRVALPDEVTVNLAANDPLAEIVGHEIAHFIENHELGADVVRKALGDPEAGIPGDFTLRDESGAPVRNPDGTFATNAEFNAARDRYLSALRRTAEQRGWSPQKLAAAEANMADPGYIAREIFAEQHLDYLQSDNYTQDLKGTGLPDWATNLSALKNTLGKLGVVFNTDGGVIESNLLGTFKKSKSLDGLMREYTRRRARAKSGELEFEGGVTVVDQVQLSKETGYVERYFDAAGEIVRDDNGQPLYDPEGRAVLRSRTETERDAKEVGKALQAHLDAQNTPPADPNEVQKRTNADGRVDYSGRYLSDAALAAIEATKRFNSVQLDNLRQVNAELRNGLGRPWTHFYQAATRKGSGTAYRSLSGRWRTDIIYGINLTQANNITFSSISLEVLNQNAANAVAKGRAKLWNNELGDLQADIRTYLDNLTSGKPGDTGIGTDKKNFINNLLGVRVKGEGDVNPLFETSNPPKTFLTALRIDRMNRVMPLGQRNVPFSTESYNRAKKNLRPDAEGETIRAYHGAFKNIRSFKSNGELGPHFGSAEAASRRLEDAAAERRNPSGSGARVYPVDLNFNRLARLPDLGNWKNAASIADAMVESLPEFSGRDLRAEIKKFDNADERGLQVPYLRDALLQSGYDGIVYKNEFEGGGDSFIALKPDDQITFQARPDTGLPGILDSLRPDEQENIVAAAQWLATNAGAKDVRKLKSVDAILKLRGEDFLFQAGESAGVNLKTMLDLAKKTEQAPKDGNGSAVGGKARLPVRGDAAESVQFEGDRLEHAVKKDVVELVHYTNASLGGVVDPGFMGKGKATARDQTGLPASFWFEKGSPLNTDRDLIARGKQTYGAKVNGGRIYDWFEDGLNLQDEPNKWKADQALVDAGYVGKALRMSDGRKLVMLFEPAAVADRGKWDGKDRAGFSPVRRRIDEGDTQFRPDTNVTETPEFKKWFGDWRDPAALTAKAKGPVSVVMDFPERRPKVVYHGTKNDFTVFESGRPTVNNYGFFGDVETTRNGMFFSDSPEQAASYATDGDGAVESGARVLPVFLDIKSPAVLDANTNFEALAEETGVSYRWLNGTANVWELFDGESGKDFVEGLKRAGYDGAIFQEDAVRDGVKTGKTYVVFEPGQIKSATANVGTFDPNNPDIRYRPDANPETQKVAADYVAKALGRSHNQTDYAVLPETRIREIADYVATEAKHEPDKPEVKAAYDALVKETKAQYEAMVAAGIEIVPWTGSQGEPYASSADMMKDVRENRRLKFFLTENGFGTDPDGKPLQHPLLEPSGIKIGGRELLNNDLFRAVHDYFGHTQQGFQFGARGEFNAFREHAAMFSEAAVGALAAETLAQNAWVNFGPHLRRPDGTIPQKGEPGYLGPQERPFADQKAFVLPEALRAQLRPDVQKSGVSTAGLFTGAEEKPKTAGDVLSIGRALAARSRAIKRIPYDSRTPGAKDAIAATLADEIDHALKQNRNALGWYEAKITEATNTLAELHPEIKEDPDRGSLYKALVAITSNGQPVNDNFARAEALYSQWKETGRIDSTSSWGGARVASINGGLAWLQKSIDERGLGDTAAFLNTKFTVGELKKLGYPINGEAVDHVVYGSAIFGPKIGGGFYPNLQGDFTPVTMDLWLMRTWNRVNGSYGQSDPVGMGRAIAALREAASQNPDAPESAEISRMSDRQLGNWAEKREHEWATVRKFKDATPFDRPAKRFVIAKEGAWESPRNSSERAWVREVFREIDNKLAERGVPAINNADKQALLWYFEKDLYALLGSSTKQQEPADYATAARRVVDSARAAR